MVCPWKSACGFQIQPIIFEKQNISSLPRPVTFCPSSCFSKIVTGTYINCMVTHLLFLLSLKQAFLPRQSVLTFTYWWWMAPLPICLTLGFCWSLHEIASVARECHNIIEIETIPARSSINWTTRMTTANS